MAVLTVLMCFASTSVFAQLKEVRGVQTRVVKYESNEKYRGTYERHGFEFKNENNYDVWVEAELWIHPYSYSTTGYDNRNVEESVRATKSFTLHAGETYVWKCGDQILEAPGLDIRNCHNVFYVKYKAYKAE